MANAIHCAAVTSGHDLALEGAAVLPELYPDRAQWPAARKRLRKRYRAMIDSGDPRLRDVGFFLFGLAEAMEAEHG